MCLCPSKMSPETSHHGQHPSCLQELVMAGGEELVRGGENQEARKKHEGEGKKEMGLANSMGGEARWEHFARSVHVASTHSPRALLPTTGHHHTSEVRPEADVIALQQFVHNLFHHRNIPSGWAEKQKKRVLIIPCATGPVREGPGWAASPEHPLRPTAPRRLCVLQPPQPWAQPPPLSFLTPIFCPWCSFWPLTCTRAPRGCQGS